MDPLDVRRNRPAASNLREPFRETASQTAGPYVHIGCLPIASGLPSEYIDQLRSNHGSGLPEGERITISGHVFDGDGVPCKDAMLEFWQAGPSGSFDDGIWLRTGTDLATGKYEIETVRPASFNDEQGAELLPFITIWIVARGINVGLLTRLYFPEDEAVFGSDPHLSYIEEARRKTLVAAPEKLTGHYQFDIRLQGKDETIFFET